MSVQGKEIARNTMIVAGATLISRGLGFVRDMIVAFVLGAGFMADAFFVAFRIPNLLRRLFGEGSLTMSFIPVYTRIRAEQGEAAAQAMARSAMIWLIVILTGITLAAELAAGGLIHIIAPGFASNPELLETTTQLLRICFPYIILISAVALCMGILNASGHFLAPALAPVMLNLALITAALTGYYLGLSVVECMAWGVLAGGFLQWQLQQPYLKRQGFTWRGAWSWRDPGVRSMALLMLPTVFGAAVYQLNIVLSTLLASYLPEGSVSYLYYADRLVQFPLGVFGIAVGTAALPSLSGLVATGRMKDFVATVRTATGLTLFIALPAMAGLVALSEPIIDLLFGRGAFTHEAVVASAQALALYSLGLPFIAASRPLVASFYAREDTRTPVIIAVFCLVLNIGLGVLLMGPMLHLGLALAVSVSSAANTLFLVLALVRRDGVCPVPLSALKSLGLAVLVLAGAWATKESGWLWLVLIPVWVGGYVAAGRVLGLEEASLVLEMVKKRARKKS